MKSCSGFPAVAYALVLLLDGLVIVCALFSLQPSSFTNHLYHLWDLLNLFAFAIESKLCINYF